MKNMFGHRSRSSFHDAASTSQPLPPKPSPEPTIPPASEASTSGLRHLIPDDIVDDESNFTGTENPISLRELFNFSNDHWVDLYGGYARKHLEEELALCELLNQDAATDENTEIDVDAMTGDVLCTFYWLLYLKHTSASILLAFRSLERAGRQPGSHAWWKSND